MNKLMAKRKPKGDVRVTATIRLDVHRVLYGLAAVIYALGVFT